jgi:ABC-2 type transport system ATP-binding protein
MNTIETKDLTKRYRELIAVDSLNLSIKKGEIFGLLGPNGAGKTTSLMMLSTLLKPTSGTAIINGFDLLKEPSKVRASIGMVFQDPSSDEILTAYENLKLHALLYNIPVKVIDKKIENVLGLVDLQKRKNDLVKTFSGGMRRRMEIARGLLHEPGIFFLDEPTIGLDPQTREHIWEYIKSLAKNTGMTIILTTHYME